jgi:Zn-dependent peptidase ImmA (M78 family)/transcriptional regulator with XRE-family HTH domain
MTRLKAVRAKPGLLVWARKNSGRDPARIAKRLRLTPEQYAAVESGARELTLAQLRLFAKLVKRPIAAFYLPSTPSDVSKPHDYRSASGSVGREAMLSFRKAERVQELSSASFKSDSKLFSIHASMSVPSARLAGLARNALGLTEGRQLAFRSSEQFSEWLIESLEGLGVHVLLHAYSIDDSKAYTLAGEPPVIVINRRDYATSRLFSILHELCHLLLRKPGMCDTIGAGGASDLETYCNRFAAEFILPTAWFDEYLQPYDDDELADDETLSRLAKTFSTSRDVVLLKLIQVGRVDRDAYERYRVRWDEDRRARRKPGGRTSVKANARRDNGGLFVSEVADAYSSNRIGLVDAADLLGVNPSYVEDVVGVVGGGG